MSSAGQEERGEERGREDARDEVASRVLSRPARIRGIYGAGPCSAGLLSISACRYFFYEPAMPRRRRPGRLASPVEVRLSPPPSDGQWQGSWADILRQGRGLPYIVPWQSLSAIKVPIPQDPNPAMRRHHGRIARHERNQHVVQCWPTAIIASIPNSIHHRCSALCTFSFNSRLPLCPSWSASAHRR